jgi:hypothetical protein
MHSMVRTSLATAGATALLTGTAFAPASAASGGEATVSILHAVPGLTVDVYANGDELLSDFTPGTLTDPQQLPAGDYDLAVYPAGADPETTDPAISADGVTVPADANITVAAHLGEGGDPMLTPFVNDTSALDAGQARLTVRHTAAAPAVDVRAGGEPVFTALTNPNEESADLPAGTVSADVVLAGTDTVALGPADLSLEEGTSTIVYAWGSAAENSLALAVQTIDGLHSTPDGVPSGQAGLVDDGIPAPLLALTVLAGAGALVAGTRVARARAGARG